MKRVCNSQSVIRNENVCIVRIALSYTCDHYTKTISPSRHLLRNCLPGSGNVDFVHDKLSKGRPYKMLAVLDEYTCHALCVEVKPKMDLADVLEALHKIPLKHWKPEYFRSENGSEFIATALRAGSSSQAAAHGS